MRKATQLSIVFLFAFVSVGAADATDVKDTTETSAMDVVDTTSTDTRDVAESDATLSGHKGESFPDIESPESVSASFTKAKKAFSAFDRGAWLVFVLAVIQVVMFIIKRLKPTRWVAKRHGTAVIMTLSAVGGVVTLVIEGNSWIEAVVVFAAAGGSKYVHDILHKFGLLNHRNEGDSEEDSDDAEDSE